MSQPRYLTFIVRALLYCITVLNPSIENIMRTSTRHSYAARHSCARLSLSNALLVVFLCITTSALAHSSPSLSLERTDAATGDSFSTDGLSKKDTTSATIAVFHNTDGLFVRGLHHAGTTLLFKLFALHPDVSPISSGKYFLSSEMLHQQLFQ